MKTEMAPAVAERGRHSLGIHFDLDALRVVETSHGKIHEWKKVSYPAGLRPGVPGFAGFLKRVLDDLSISRHVPVWASASLPTLQVRFLSLPKVRPRQVSNLVYWTFRKEIPFDAAQVMFDYDVEGESTGEGGARKIDVTACTVAHADIKMISAVFEEAQLNLEGLVLPSFAMRNVVRLLSVTSKETVLALHVGDDASAIMFVRAGRVVSHRVFKTGMNVMVDVLRDRHPEWTPSIAAAKMNAALREVVPVPAPGEMDESENGRIRSTVYAAFARLIQQVERTISAYLTGRGDETISTIYVAGILADEPALVNELGSKLGLNTRPLNAFADHLELEKDVAPMSPGESGAMAIATGASLSDPAHTPNLLHTYVKREHEMRLTRTRRAVTALGIAALLVLFALHGIIQYFNRGLREELTLIQSQIERFAPYPDRAMILDLSTKAAIRSSKLKAMAERCQILASLNQLAAGTSPDIRLHSIVIEQHEVASSRDLRRKNGGASGPVANGAGGIHAHMKGVVSGDPGLQESKLAQYILQVEQTDLFHRAWLTGSEAARDAGNPVLRFDVDVQMESLADIPAAVSEVATTKEVRP